MAQVASSLPQLPALDKAPQNIYPEKTDPTRLFLAYGRRTIPKLVDEAMSEQLDTRQRALISLAELFHNPEFIAQGLKENIVAKLTEMFLDDEDNPTDLTVRQKASECLATISGYAVGRNALIKWASLFPISKLFNDEDSMVRRNAHTAFARCSVQKTCVENILPWGVIEILVGKLTTEREDIQIIILDCLYNCIRYEDALKCDAMTVLTELMKPYSVTNVKVGTAKCIMMLCFHPEGKKAALAGQTIAILIDSLLDFKAQVRAASAGALMSISIDVEAKKVLVRENAIPTLMKLLNDKDESVLLNTIKTISNCAEDYRGRFQLHGCFKKLEVFSKSENKLLADAALKAMKVITWRP